MFCSKCGGRVPGGSRFCPVCGTAAAPAAPPAPPAGFSRAGGLDLGVAPEVIPVAAPKPQAPAQPCGHPAEAEVFTAAFAVPPKAEAPAPETSCRESAPAAQTTDRRISPKREYKLLLRQGWLVMLGEKRNLIISLLFPVIAAVITVWIAGKDMFENYESTKSACFILVCAGIWCGLFNSIATIVKERENIKRDYVSGALRIGCYTASRAVLQLRLCAVQALVLTFSIPMVGLVYGNDVPSEGALGLPAVIEYYISLFLLMYAADTMGLMISAFVKKEELASKLAPYILIVQLLFSGMFFEMEGAAQAISVLMLSRWGMEALGSVSDLNDLPFRVHKEFPQSEAIIKHKSEDVFDCDPEHMLPVIFVLLLFIGGFLLLCNTFLKKVKNDARS